MQNRPSFARRNRIWKHEESGLKAASLGHVCSRQGIGSRVCQPVVGLSS